MLPLQISVADDDAVIDGFVNMFTFTGIMKDEQPVRVLVPRI